MPQVPAEGGQQVFICGKPAKEVKDEYSRTWETNFGKAYPCDRFAPSKVPGSDGEFATREV
eukprot:10843432-Alexandrium_andersonii.AAC.1